MTEADTKTGYPHAVLLEYLRSADKAQADIAIETRFFETSKDPRKEFGIDWSGTLAGGYPLSLTGLTTNIDLNNLSAFQFPMSAVLSAGDVQMRIKALLTDRDTETVSFPRVATVNNREVVIRSVVNIPVLASNSTSQTTVTTQSQTVEYLPVGTVINILPKLMPTGAVRLRVTITISSQIGTQTLIGNPYPVTSSRVYSGEAYVNSGFTLAVGGLEETTLSMNGNKVPVLGDIPFFGWFFRSQDNERNRKNLMFFITPTVLESYSGGIKIVRDTRLDESSDEVSPDNSKPNLSNFANLAYWSDYCPLVDRGIIAMVTQNNSPDAIIRRSKLFEKLSEIPASSFVVNPKEYGFNKRQPRAELVYNDNVDVSECDRWSYQMLKDYYNYFAAKASTAYDAEEDAQGRLAKIKSHGEEVGATSTAAYQQYQAKALTSVNEYKGSLDTYLTKMEILLAQRVKAYGQLVNYLAMVSGSRKVEPTSDVTKFLDADEATYVSSSEVIEGQRNRAITLAKERRKNLIAMSQDLAKAQSKAGLKPSAAGLVKEIEELDPRLNKVIAKY